MAFNVTAIDTTTNNELLESKGSYSGFAVGIGLAVSTTLTVTVPGLKTVKGVVMTPETAAATITLTSTSGNTFTATASQSGDTIHWIAWGDANS